MEKDMAEWQIDNGFRWRSVEPFGAEIDHDLSQPLSGPVAERFVSLFREHHLIIARRQVLSRSAQENLLALLGPLMLNRQNATGFITTDMSHISATAEYPFHSDGAYTENPFEALSLHAVDVVDGASSTRFVDVEQCYQTLPPALRDQLQAHDAEMIKSTYDSVGVRAFEIRDPPAIRRDERPAVRIHPHSNRPYLAVNEMQTTRLLGMAWEDSRALLADVFDHAYAPQNIHEHVWHQGDLVIWDNIACQHARGSLEGAGRRVLQRVMVGGEDC
ncbi:TauD/TfdA family dioxygenase [Sphingomonas sp. YR710]|uniref:TauD/TfdA dioxygenase family protein n=1 Tax=Sphingomonas sp. YR710 TaxID=1882773 RepID=UPI00115FB493|nr:TauD/TfdA family dioxygenase [Sphingomonas sp. YR710]